ncbi:lipase [Xylaria palmicola]|nr:lipase [Xylaria palmicola]
MKLPSWSLILSFALVALNSPLAETAMLLENDGVLVSEETWTRVKLMAQYSASAYCNWGVRRGTNISCDTCPDVTAAGVTIVEISGGEGTGVVGFVAVDPKNQLIVAVVRGSASARNWTSIQFAKRRCNKLVQHCHVHDGFARAWDEISHWMLYGVRKAKAAHPSYEIVFTGHSLGGAVSTLGAAYARKEGMAVDLYTYGCPRVGNEAFAMFVNRQPGVEYRVTHLSDPFARMPPMFLGYAHTSPELWLHSGSPTTIKYERSDVKVCHGVQSHHCNGGTSEPNFKAHNYYLCHTCECSRVKPQAKREGDDYLSWLGTSPLKDLTDEQFEARLRDWARKDIEMMTKLESNGSSLALLEED